MIVSSPMDEAELRNLMYTAQLPDMGPFSIRYPRGNGTHIDWQTPFEKIEVGTGRELSEGTDLVFLTIGPIGAKVQRIVAQLQEEDISAGHCDMRFVKPLDEVLLHKVFANHQKIITIEDGSIVGGLGTAVIEFMADNGYSATIKRLGIPDKFIDQGTQTELARDCGFDMEGIRQAARALVGKPHKAP